MKRNWISPLIEELTIDKTQHTSGCQTNNWTNKCTTTIKLDCGSNFGKQTKTWSTNTSHTSNQTNIWKWLSQFFKR